MCGVAQSTQALGAVTHLETFGETLSVQFNAALGLRLPLRGGRFERKENQRMVSWEEAG
jgi:hypothetical protein